MEAGTLLIVAIILWVLFAIFHPIATILAIILAFMTPDAHILNAYAAWTFFFALFVTRIGQGFLVGLGAGFIVQMIKSKRMR